MTLELARAKIDPEAEVGDQLLAKLPPEQFGRIAAQAAKQNLIQRVRDAERDVIYNEFKGRKGELFSGIVQRFERKSIIVKLGRTDAILPEKEQIPRERYRQGDRIRAFIVDVELTGKGPQIVLSRTHPGLLIKLFEQEVPEIYEGIVEVKGAAREPGGRAKIAVISNDRDVDPVGACVGMRGTRVQAVVQELRGEKIDIVLWRSDPAEYMCRALAPAAVSKIIMDEDEHAMEVIVPDDQLSLAIGKKGQNVRLASHLTGWKVDLRSESEAEDEARRAPGAPGDSAAGRHCGGAVVPEWIQVGGGTGGVGRGDGGRHRGHRPGARGHHSCGSEAVRRPEARGGGRPRYGGGRQGQRAGARDSTGHGAALGRGPGMSGNCGPRFAYPFTARLQWCGRWREPIERRDLWATSHPSRRSAARSRRSPQRQRARPR